MGYPGCFVLTKTFPITGRIPRPIGPVENLDEYRFCDVWHTRMMRQWLEHILLSPGAQVLGLAKLPHALKNVHVR